MKVIFTLVFALLACAQISHSQSALVTNCDNFSASYTTTESRCAATGTITIAATGGSGNYSYKILEPFTTPLTSTPVMSGLPPGNYTVFTKDMNSGCTIIEENIVVAGSYSDPRFQLAKTDLTCTGSTDGSISVVNQQFGRGPLDYTIVAPSPAAVGTTNTNGVFTNLPAGYYYIQLRDSCGGIQTRSISILDYTWAISAQTVTKTVCNTVAVTISLLDNKGNTNISGTAFSGFTYGAVVAAGDTSWFTTRAFNYSNTPLRNVRFVVKDRCGKVQSFNWTNNIPTMGSNVNTGSLSCSTFSASVTGTSNLGTGRFYLMQGSTVIQDNNTGSFSNIPYGSYCIQLREPCYDTSITSCFTLNAAKPVAAAGVTLSAQTCSTFTAAVTGMNNLYSPSYSIYTSTNVFVATSTNGSFPNLAYGDYCIRIVSAAPCYDTTIQRCFTATQPRPVVPVSVTTNNVTCSGFDASINGTFLSNPNFCLYNTITNTLIGCNNTGLFPGLSFGQYCIKIKSQAPCYDTTIERCFIVNQPQPTAGDPVITGRNCTGFNVSIPSVTNIQNPEYCLFDGSGNPLGCNDSGIFNGLLYGSYSIRITSTLSGGACPVVPVTKSFNITKLIPTADANVTTGNKTCTTFSADITGELNLFNQHYYLVDLAGNPIADNSTGTFYNIPYGAYKIIIRDNCPATYLERAVTVNAAPLAFTVAATESCTFTTTNVKLTMGAGQAPYQAKVLNPMNSVVASYTFSTSTYTFSDLPALSAGLEYRVVVTSACGETQTVNVAPKTSLFSRTNTVSAKCPSAAWENGSGEIVAELVSNIGLYQPTIIKRNGVAVNLVPGLTQNISANHRRYIFSDMSPATYILEYNLTGCSKKVNDTITVTNYQYPNLLNSAAYQCDNSNFSVSAVASNGVSPFTYEIIGSNGGPTINAPMQSGSVFNINTSANYSLVRMRAVDACGNGTLNDVSVLPLGILTIQVNNVDCYSNNITLSVDTIPNATYAWYKKTTPEDSVLIGTSQSYNIPSLFPTHTGLYVCKTIVNNGCLVRLSYYHLRGGCSIILPVKMLSFEGRLENDQVPLKWKVAEEKSVKSYQVEKKNGAGAFELIGSVKAANHGENTYTHTDLNPGTGILQYRLKITGEDGLVTYSNIVTIQRDLVDIVAGPNPVKDVLNIQISGREEAVYEIVLVSLSGQTVHSQETSPLRAGTIRIQRNSRLTPGMYILKIRNKSSGYLFTTKMLFQ